MTSILNSKSFKKSSIALCLMGLNLSAVAQITAPPTNNDQYTGLIFDSTFTESSKAYLQAFANSGIYRVHKADGTTEDLKAKELNGQLSVEVNVTEKDLFFSYSDFGGVGILHDIYGKPLPNFIFNFKENVNFGLIEVAELVKSKFNIAENKTMAFYGGLNSRAIDITQSGYLDISGEKASVKFINLNAENESFALVSVIDTWNGPGSAGGLTINVQDIEFINSNITPSNRKIALKTNGGNAKLTANEFTIHSDKEASRFTHGLLVEHMGDINITANNVTIDANNAVSAVGDPDDGYLPDGLLAEITIKANSAHIFGQTSAGVGGKVNYLQDSALFPSQKLHLINEGADAILAFESVKEGQSVINIETNTFISSQGVDTEYHGTESDGLVAAIRSTQGSLVNLNTDASRYEIYGDIIATRLGIDHSFTSTINIGGTGTVIVGNALASNASVIDISLNQNGFWHGMANDFRFDLNKEEIDHNISAKNPSYLISEAGVINVSLNNNSAWYVSGNSNISKLSIDNGVLDLRGWETTKQSDNEYHQLTTDTLSSQNGQLFIHANLSNSKSDRLSIVGSALGKFEANIDLSGDTKSSVLSNWLISQGENSNLFITNKEGENKYSGNGMTSVWSLAFVENEINDSNLADLKPTTEGKGKGYWYLMRTDKDEQNPNPEQPGPNDPAEMQQITNLGISATQALSFASELEDLRGRLGEVRYGAQDGAWVRAGYTKETADGYNGRGFEQKTHDLHIGLDRIIAADEDSSWLVGGALRYAKSKQEGFTAARGGEGELEQYSAKLYATYMHAQGSYADFVVQAGRYSQDLTGLANDLSSAFKADYKTYGYGASVEIGHMFDFNNQVDDRQWFNHFFIEPQLQLSYFNAHGKDYKTSTGLAVSQSDADFLTGRAGVVLGKKFNYGTADDLDKRYFQVGLKGGVKYEFLGDQTIRFTGVERVTKERQADDVDGARYYYGVTADWQLSHNFRAYATVEREEGDHYTKDFDVSVGVKYQF